MYTLYRSMTKLSLYKDDQVEFRGEMDVNLSVYGFRFSDNKGNEYHMKATGMFFWRKLNLFKNGLLVEGYKKIDPFRVTFDCHPFEM